jgi:hypothetical protein
MNGPAEFYVQAWNRIMPAVVQILSPDDYSRIRESVDPLQELRLGVALHVSPVELQHLGIFLQGGDISKKILSNCIEAHLEEVKEP